MEKKGLRVIRFHDLRHTAASLLAPNVNPQQLQKFLGHEDISTTYGIYDIETTYGLIHYHPGCSIDPNLLGHIRRFFASYTKMAQEERMSALKESGVTECFRFLAKNPQLKLRDCDWQQIYDRLCADPESFARYYPAGQAEIESDAAMYVLRAILTNDDFYALLRGEQSGS